MKQEFVIEYQDGKFPTQVCMNVWGEDRVKDLDAFQLGDDVVVSFTPSSREFNGKWYTDLRAWRIVHKDANVSGGAATSAAPASSAPASQNVAPAPSESSSSDDEFGDDLPF